MSREIIEKPTHKCKVCGCVFSFEREDFQFGQDRDNRHITFVMCPICDTAFVVKEQKVYKDK